MLARRIWIMLLVVTATLVGVAGCTPGMVVESGATDTSSDAVTSTTQVESNTEQASGQSESSPGAAGAESQTEAEVEDGAQPAAMTEYIDSTYQFGVSYPSDFVFRTQSAENLSQLTPKPDTSFIFMNPETAASDLGDLEPADLEIRVYDAGEAESLESWLTTNGLLPADGSVTPETFQTATVSGLRVCASTMIAPGCSNFVLGNGFVYQLTPVTLEGEAMTETFRLIP